MQIEYHKRAWCCPRCKLWIAVNRRKVGSHIRVCPNCKSKTMVTTKPITRQVQVTENEITAQPVDMGV